MLTSRLQARSAPVSEILPSWTFDPRRTEVGFRARRMGRVWVDGRFKDVRGRFNLDVDDPLAGSCTGEIDATKLYAGEPYLNTQLRTADFLDVDAHPTIKFAGRLVERTSDTDFKGDVLLTLRGVTQLVVMDVMYFGQWTAPLGRDPGDDRAATRIGLRAEGLITRDLFGIQAEGNGANGHAGTANAIEITFEIEAVLDADLRRLGVLEA